MTFQRLVCAVGLASLSYFYALVLLSGRAVAGSGSMPSGCADLNIADGFCDVRNNNEHCGYDGGDCCECTCISSDVFTCGDEEFGAFECLDPEARCSDDDIIDIAPSDGHDFFLARFPNPASCLEHFIGDGDCDSANNKEECGYDGGDCCECDCTSNSISTCGFYNAFDCVDPTSPCVNGYVEAGTKTTVGVSANGYHTRLGKNSDGSGCLADGCAPALTRDGISADVESRWSCAQEAAPGRGLCEIQFTFESPQDLMAVQVAFWKGDERLRTLEVAVNGEIVGSFDSYPGSVFNALDIQESGVQTLTLTSTGIDDDQWTSLLEVRFLVEP